MKQVVIIGGGFAGIISLQTCLENGLDAYCYERLEDYGGLWRYRENVDVDGISSVTQNTIINTSKEMGAISNFPPPDDFPNYMHNSKMIEYLGLYIQKHNLKARIKYQHEILKLEKSSTYESDGGWNVLIENKATGEESLVEARAVLVCVGHHSYPNYPKFPGQDDFQGTIIHSHSLKNPSKFEGKRVVIVGGGNSAMDAAAELSYRCEQVYLSIRKGVWIAPLMGSNNNPEDFRITRYNQYKYNHFPSQWRSTAEKKLKSHFDHDKMGLKPKHHIDQKSVTISNIVPPRILSGAIHVKDDILRLTPTGVIFKGDEHDKTSIAIDAIIACTGYNLHVPFLPKDTELLGQNGNFGLFARIFPVHLSHPTLAFIGFVQPFGPFFPVMELQARWVCRLICEMERSRNDLSAYGWPATTSERAQEVAKYQAYIASRFGNLDKKPIQVDFVTYTDFLAEQIGCKPNLIKLAVTDPVLCYKLMFGPQLPYQFRLTGPNSWPNARQTLMSVDKRVKKGFRMRDISNDSSKEINFVHYFLLMACFAIFFEIIKTSITYIY